jgi:hypothetical protein
MTQIIRKQQPWIARELSSKLNPRKIEKIVLNALFRNYCFVLSSQNIRALTNQEKTNIAVSTGLSASLIHSVISKFLVNLVYFRRFLRSYQFTYKHTKSLRKLQLYLHKFHRIAPIFDFTRAKENARILKNLLNQLCFMPQFTTQLAIVIFVTDINDKKFENKIVQTNLRLLCNCSAYAFHRTRNRLGLK